MKKKLLSLLMVLAVSMTFVLSFAMAGNDVYAAAKSPKYYLPTNVWGYDYTTGESSSLNNIKYDKYGNIKSAWLSEMIPVKYTIKYKNKKGVVSAVTYGNSDTTAKKYYDKKGRLKKVKTGKDTYKYKTNKKGIIKNVTRNGKKYYTVKKVKYHKNGFVSKVVYGNGNVNKYNSSGLMTSVKLKNGTKFTYKYTKKNGKVVKAVIKRNGKNYRKYTFEYGKATTKDVWKYSCLIYYAGGPSNAGELYAYSPLSGVNSADW